MSNDSSSGSSIGVCCCRYYSNFPSLNLNSETRYYPYQPTWYIAGLHHYLGDDKKTSLLWSKTWCLCSTSNMMTKNRGRNKLKVVITICVQIVHAPPLFFAVFETSTSEQEADTRITQLHRSTVRKRSQKQFCIALMSFILAYVWPAKQVQQQPQSNREWGRKTPGRK